MAVCVILPVYLVSQRCQHFTSRGQTYCLQCKLAYTLCKYAVPSTEVVKHEMHEDVDAETVGSCCHRRAW
jgi:hypothetical protein